MSIEDIFILLITDKNETPLFNLIMEIKNSIPDKQKIGKGIVWSLRQVRKQVQKEVPLDLQKQALDILISSNLWQIRKLTAFLASSCASEEKSIKYYINFIKKAANDSHFGVRESAQMALRELLQVFPNQIFLVYQEWIVDSNEYTRRCVSESLRPVLVNGRNWIREKPEKAIKILKYLNRDPSLYVRKSVGNNLSDISRRQPELVLATLHEWLLENEYDNRTFFIARKACRNIVKNNPKGVNKLLRGSSIIR
jgi:3-methyladenine DNA glycosylase AlkC